MLTASQVTSFNYRPQRSCGKVMFLHLSVILFTGGMADTALGRYSPSRHPPLPLKQTATTADGTNPTGMHCCCLKVSLYRRHQFFSTSAWLLWHFLTKQNHPLLHQLQNKIDYETRPDSRQQYAVFLGIPTLSYYPKKPNVKEDKYNSAHVNPGEAAVFYWQQ